MVKPTLLLLDDNEELLDELEAAFEQKFGQQCDIFIASSGAHAFDELRRSLLEGKPIAGLVTDQFLERDPDDDSPQRGEYETGTQFLRMAKNLFPNAFRVVYSGHVDKHGHETPVTITELQLSAYLEKESHHKRLLKDVTTLLARWFHENLEFAGKRNVVRVAGTAENARKLRETLAKNLIPHEWLNLLRDSEAMSVVKAHCEQCEIDAETMLNQPILLVTGKEPQIDPKPSKVLESLEPLRIKDEEGYALVIVGGGPAGLASAIFAGSEGLKTLLVDSQAEGGQAGRSARIENYFGIRGGISGPQLGRIGVEQARFFGVDVIAPITAKKLRRREDRRYTVTLSNSVSITADCVLIASGAEWRKHSARGIDGLTGHGVYYGSVISHAYKYIDKKAFIVGGGNSAGQQALHMSKFAREVTLLVRSTGLTKMSQYLIDRINAIDNIFVEYGTTVESVAGERELESLTLVKKSPNVTPGEVANSPKSGQSDAYDWKSAGPENEFMRATGVPADALFIFIGMEPQTKWLRGSGVTLDTKIHSRKDIREKYPLLQPMGYVVTGDNMVRRPQAFQEFGRKPWDLETNLPGVFAAGDIRFKPELVPRVARAVGEGSNVVGYVHKHRKDL
ncbi:MAG: FAD-dependent oxidoreductase [Planctomycetota bacterium]